MQNSWTSWFSSAGTGCAGPGAVPTTPRRRRSPLRRAPTTTSDRRALVHERGHRDAPPVADGAEPVRIGDAGIVQVAVEQVGAAAPWPAAVTRARAPWAPPCRA